jgi:recombination protein RecA
MAPPFRQIEFDIMYGEGISKMGELLDLGVQGNIVEKSGAWFSYDGQRIGQGRENSKNFLRENPDVAKELEAQIRKNAGILADSMLTGPDSAENAAETAAEDVANDGETGTKGKKAAS